MFPTASLLLVLALAQAAPRDIGSVSGVVVDPLGSAVPGAEVRLQGIGNNTEKRQTTGLDGSFHFLQVPAGRFEIHVELTHFKPARTEVSLGRRALPPLRFTLQLVDLKQELVVTEDQARLSVNSGENLDTIELDRSLLDTLPSMGNDVVAAAAIFLDPALVGAAGATLVVDGMETSKVGVSSSAIREVRINRNPYSAEFFSPGRGRIEVTTAREPARFTGSLSFLFRDHRLDARNAFAEFRPPEQRRNLEGHVTGPLGRSKKNSFLVSAERGDDRQWEQIYALTPAGLLRDQIATPEWDTDVSVQFLRQLSKLSSFSLRYEHESGFAEGRGVGGFALPEVAAREDSGEQAIHFSYRTVTSRTLLLELQGRLRRSDETTRSLRAGIPMIVVQDAFTAGAGQENTRATNVHGEFSQAASWVRGKHSFRMGVSLRDLGRDDYHDLNDRDGTFYFSSLEDHAAGKPFSFVKQTGDGRVVFWRTEGGAFFQDDFRIRSNLALALGVRYDLQSHLADHNNLAPRLSLAFAPGRKRNTVLRAGAGLFYDRFGAGEVRSTLLFDGIRLRQVVLPSPGYPDPFAGTGGILDQPPTIVRFASNLKAPYFLNYSVGLERQLGGQSGFTVQYNGIRGINLFRSRDLNTPLPPDIERPDSSIGVLRQIESSARLAVHALEASVRGKLGRFYDGGVTYTLSRAFTDTSGIGSLPADSRALSGEWGRANYDRTHRLRVYGTVKASKLFTVGTMLAVESGSPYSLTTGRDDNHDGRATDRPPRVSRNTLEGTGGAILDLRWSRRWNLGGTNGSRSEGQPSVTIALDSFNVLNHVVYSNFVGNMSSPFFGRPVAARSARRIQIGLQFAF